MPHPFQPGLQLSEVFYNEAVRPILDTQFPGLAHAAALMGPGSEVLGYDDPMSTDHDWGPRLMLYLDEQDRELYADEVRSALAVGLPAVFLGYSTNYSAPNVTDNGTQHMEIAEPGSSLNHRVAVQTPRQFFLDYLNFDIAHPLEPADWLTLPEQRLRSVTSGALFQDEIDLAQIRGRFATYPHDVWLYLLGCGWARIGQEEHLMGRAGISGDEIGSALIGARLVRDIMQLCFLMSRIYAPYPKWFGRAFQELSCAHDFSPHLTSALAATDWASRQRHLTPAYEALARMHNSLGLTAQMPERVTRFFNRPFEVIALQGFTDALFAEITEPAVRQIVDRPPIGSIDQFSDSTDLLSNVSWRPVLRRLYTRQTDVSTESSLL